MKGRIDTEGTSPFPGFQRLENETILFCGHTNRRVRNPWDSNRKHPETVMLTDRRLAVLSKIAPGRSMSAVNEMHLDQISSIQCTYLAWDAWNVIACVLLFFLYIIPGVIFLIYMTRNVGLNVQVISGILRTEMKFDPKHSALLDKFLGLIQKRA